MKNRSTMLNLLLILVFSFVGALLIGCLEVRDDGDADNSDLKDECGDCHMLGNLSGAHYAHSTVEGGLFSDLVLGCEDCHVVTHKDGYQETNVEWFPEGSMATTGGLQPTWDGASCADTYCHGGGLRGGLNVDPIWASDEDQVKCGSCHGVPPTQPHPVNSASCSTCHSGAYVDGELNPLKHIDGILDMGVEQ